jgi:hypothetical protein
MTTGPMDLGEDEVPITWAPSLLMPNIFGRSVVAFVLELPARQPRDMGSPRQSQEGNIMCGRA